MMQMRLLKWVLLVTILILAQGHRVKCMQPMPGYGEMVKKMQQMSMMMPDPKVGEMVNSMSSTDGNPEEMGTYYESDMLVPMDRKDVKMAEKFQFRWSNGIVPYRIDGNFSPEQRDTILKAMEQFPRYTCVRFVPHNGEKDYVVFENKPTGCWSALGRIGNKQPLNLQAPGCVTLIGTPMHEMMHALGIFHEQSRADRDQFIRVRWENILRGKEHNFKEHAKYYGFGQPYDYESVMHYSLKAFSKNNDRTLDPSTTVGVRSVPNIGQRSGFSKADIAKINNLYGCDEIKSNEIETKLTPPTPKPIRPDFGPGPEYPRPNYGRPDFRPNYGKPDYGRPDFEKHGYGRPEYERPGYGGRPQFPGNSITSFEKSFVISSGRNYHKEENEIAIAITEDVERTTKATYTTLPVTKTTRKKFFGIF